MRVVEYLKRQCRCGHSNSTVEMYGKKEIARCTNNPHGGVCFNADGANGFGLSANHLY